MQVKTERDCHALERLRRRYGVKISIEELGTIGARLTATPYVGPDKFLYRVQDDLTAWGVDMTGYGYNGLATCLVSASSRRIVTFLLPRGACESTGLQRYSANAYNRSRRRRRESEADDNRGPRRRLRVDEDWDDPIRN